ncbi:hypothetical protein TL16_g03327 [Triparma laevis f. inornata]|uniref:Uncharacterized protein n=1 Tax=Triparma laevis f. inornata TaxID=1714386 RepID=A0A9W6ZWK5_9STRA|nr:hypothetical protein TL16_g03327 [Triparma laevis f. inornata]
MSEVYLQIKKDFSMGVPSSPEGELQSEIKKCVGKINALLSPASFSISLHHSPPETHYVFHNVLADAIAIKYGSNMSIEEVSEGGGGGGWQKGEGRNVLDDDIFKMTFVVLKPARFHFAHPFTTNSNHHHTQFGLFKAALESIVSETAAAAASKSKDDDDDDDDDDNSDDEAQNPSSSSGSSSGISKGKFISLRTSETATATVDNNANSENSASGENTTNSSSTSPKKAKPLTANKAEKLFQRLLNEKWLVEGNKKVTIGSRAWVEMGEMIRSMGAEGGGQVVTLR